jgi:hypothetical protein
MADNTISIDNETFFSERLKYTLKIQIAEQYCNSPLFDPFMVSVCNGSAAWAGHPKDFNWQSINGATLLSHNRYFDNTVFNRQKQLGQIPAEVNYAAWHCTANLTSYLCNRRSLADAVEFLFKVKLDKSARSDANNKRWPADFPPVEQARMLNYAKDDAIWCKRIWDNFSPKWPDSERRISNLTIDQSMRGVQIDVKRLNNYLMWTHEMKTATETLLPWLDDAGDDFLSDDDWGVKVPKPTSTKCVAEQCRRSGIPAPPVISREGEEAFEDWQSQYAPNHPWIRALSAWRSINKLYKTFCLVKERLRPDGTMPFGSKYFGAHTGRVSGEARVNMYNMRKVPVFCNEHHLMETDERRVLAAVDERHETGKWPEWVRYVIDFRALIIPRPGKKMIVCDLAQIEPRVLAWLAGDHELLKMLESGMSIYEAHARTKMGWRGGSLKKENPSMYALAKANVLALGYGAGWEKYITMAYDLARVDITKDDPEWVEEVNPFTGEVTKVSGYGVTARRTVADYREGNKRIVALWKRLDEAFKQSVGSDCVLRLPTGRAMTYERVRCETRIVQDKKTKKPKRESVFTASVGNRRVPFYGGKLAENITQATARDVFMEHVLALDDAGVDVLFGVYDEAICEVDNNVTPCDIEAIMSKTPSWLAGCPVGAEGAEVAHYCK